MQLEGTEPCRGELVGLFGRASDERPAVGGGRAAVHAPSARGARERGVHRADDGDEPAVDIEARDLRPATFDLERDSRTGLGNTRSRLERLYGRSAQLRVSPREGGGTVADILVPARAMVVATEATA